MGPADEGARIAKRALPLLDTATDPYFRASFLDSAARGLVLSARYDDAIALAIREIAEAEHQRLDFVLASALCVRALAEGGLREYQAAHASIDRDAGMLHPNDVHQQVEAAAIRARLFISQQRFEEALSVTARDPVRRPAPGMWGEYVATRLLALACVGDFDGAEQLEQEAELTSRAIELRVLLPLTRAIVAIGREARNAEAIAEEAFAVAVRLSNYDNFVCACRASPALIRTLASKTQTKSKLAALFLRIGDTTLAHAVGASVTPDRRLLAPLSPRETEVLSLVAEGRSNREIAQRLYISEVTVKVHLRHIFETFVED